MKRNDLAITFVAKVLNLWRNNHETTIEEAIYDARNYLCVLPEYESNKVFSREDVEYIQKELASVFKTDWRDFDEDFFYNNNLYAVLNY